MINSKNWQVYAILAGIVLILAFSLLTKKDNENKISFALPKLASKTQTKTTN